MFDVVTFGEAMIRLVPPHFQRLEQTTSLDVQIGGGELNVAVGVGRLGLKSAWVSRLPKNALGRLLENRVRQAGGDASELGALRSRLLRHQCYPAGRGRLEARLHGREVVSYERHHTGAQ